MALWKPFRGSRADLDSVSKHDGYVYFCVDDGSLFFDYQDAEGNLQRKQINATELENLGLAIADIQAELENKTSSNIPLEEGAGKNSLQQVGYNSSDAAQNKDGVNINSGDTSVVFGDSNINHGQSALVVGSCNNNEAEGGFSIISGTWNNNAEDGYNSIIAGHDNANKARSSIVAGNNNVNEGQDGWIAGYNNHIHSDTNNCAVLGRDNELQGRDSLVVGADNALGIAEKADGNSAAILGCAIAAGFENEINGGAGLTVGTECRNDHNYCVVGGVDLETCGDHQAVFGQYNAPVNNANLVVGCGSSSNRKNAIEVLDTGSTVLRGNLYIKGNVKDPINAESNLTVAGETTLNGRTIMNGGTTINGGFSCDAFWWNTLKEDMVLNGSLLASNATFNNSVDFNDKVTFNGDVQGLPNPSTLATRARGSQIVLNDGTEGAVRGHVLMIGNNSNQDSGNQSILVGDGNTNQTANSVLVGKSNYTTPAAIDNNFLAGKGLYSDWSDTAIVGKYNLKDLEDQPLFIVGNGSSDADRNNALVVNADGEVVADTFVGNLSGNAMKDGLGQVISDTYATKTELSNGLNNKIATSEIIDTAIAYRRDISNNVLPYAKVNKVGGMTSRCKNLVQSLYGVKQPVYIPAGTKFSVSCANKMADDMYILLYDKDGNRFDSFTINSTLVDGRIGRHGIFTSQDTYAVMFSWAKVTEIIDAQLEISDIITEYVPYFEGIRPTPVTEIESKGANLIKYPYLDKSGTVNGITFTDNGDGSVTADGTATADTYFRFSEYDVYPNQARTLSGGPAGGSSATYCLEASGFIPDFGDGYTIKHTSYFYGTIRIRIKSGTTVNNLTFRPMFNEGEVALPYSLYGAKGSLPIPESVQTLDGYGEGINADCYNYIDWEKKQFVKQVGKVDMGTLTWDLASNDVFYAQIEKKQNGLSNFLCSEYTNANTVWAEMANKTITGNDVIPYVYIKDDRYGSSDHFQLALAGKILYYELATPEIIDISNLLSKNNSLGVEGGGLIIMQNEYRNSVPVSITCYESNNEIIGANTVIGDLVGTAAYAISDASGNTIEETYATKTELNAGLNNRIATSQKGVANGIAELDANGKVPASQLPSFGDDIIEGNLTAEDIFDNVDGYPVVPESGKIYVDTTTNKTYRWSGSAYVEISASLALGETSSTAYRGDRGKIAYDHSQTAHAPSNAQANVQSDWNATSGDAFIKNKPTIPTVNNGTLTIQKNGTTVNTFTANSASNVTANITVPTKTSELTNDSGFITGITIDSALDGTSINPVQNQAVYHALNAKAPTNHSHSDLYYSKAEVDAKVSNASGGGSSSPTRLKYKADIDSSTPIVLNRADIEDKEIIIHSFSTIEAGDKTIVSTSMIFVHSNDYADIDVSRTDLKYYGASMQIATLSNSLTTAIPVLEYNQMRVGFELKFVDDTGAYVNNMGGYCNIYVR